jgi:hypothetical protein
MQGKGKDAADTSKRGDAVRADEAAEGGASLSTEAQTMALEVPHREAGTAFQAHSGGGDGVAGDFDAEPGDDDVRIDEAAQALIGQHLKAIYSEIVQQPVPDELLKLLEDLERKERS